MHAGLPPTRSVFRDGVARAARGPLEDTHDKDTRDILTGPAALAPRPRGCCAGRDNHLVRSNDKHDGRW
jgi:hypothetical protein